LALGTHPAWVVSLLVFMSFADTFYSSVALNLDHSTISISPNRGPTYDQTYLNQLKASTPTSRPRLADDAYDADTSMNIADVSLGDMDVDIGRYFYFNKYKRYSFTFR